MTVIDTLLLVVCLFLTGFNFVSSASADGDSTSAPVNETPNITDPVTGHYRAANGRSGPQQAQFQSQPELGTSSPNGREVPAIPNPDELIYTMPTLVGGQQLMLQLDTGSADL